MEENRLERQRCEAVEHLTLVIGRELSREGEEISDEVEELLWRTLELFQGVTFHTAKYLTFSYSIKGNEMFVSRKDKSLTRATVALALRMALKQQRDCGAVTGPKKLGTFGASYLYPIFISLGVIVKTEVD